MTTSEYVPLRDLTTMKLGGTARYVITLDSQPELEEAISFARKQSLPWFVLGSGSNVVAESDYNGIILLNRIKGFDKLDENDLSATYRIGAGEVWDRIVEQLCDADLSGVEAMSAIPGYTGATPIQNVGAYGQEIADTLVELEAYDSDTNQLVTLSHDDCKFSYRNSIFKNPKTRHHIIMNITLKLNKTHLGPPFYPVLQKYLSENNISDYSPSNVRAAVTAIRSEKLPPVNQIASAGSFFKNPIVTQQTADVLISKFPDAPHWPMPDNTVKLAAGWLIEQAGLKGFEKYGMQVYPKNALVLTNVAAQSYNDLSKFKAEIIAKVQGKFGVVLEQEPENLT